MTSGEGPSGWLVQQEMEPASAEAKLALVREVAGAAFWEYDLRSGQVAADEQLLTLYGYTSHGSSTRDLALGYEAWREHVHPDDRGWVEARFREALEHLEPWDLTYRIRTVDGRTRCVRSLGRVTPDARGELRRVIGLEYEVTGRVEREQALEAANNRLEDAEQIARLGHWVDYADSGELVWSPMTYELCGFDPREPPPTFAELIERVPLEDRHEVAEFQFQADPQLSASEGTYRIRHPDGRVLWLREVAEQWRDEQGRWVVQGTIQDVTDYQRTLLALRERQRQHEAIFNRASSVSLMQTDLEGVIQEASRGAEALLGYAREELIGHSVEGLFPQEGRGVPRHLLARVARQRQEITEEVRLRHRSGAIFPALLDLLPVVDEADQVIGAIGVCMDLSEQAAERERYRLAQGAARFGVWEWDLERDAIYWDEACWRMLGYDPAEGRPLGFADWQAWVHPDDRAEIEPVVRAQIEQGEPFTIVFRYRCADGGWLWVQGRGQIVARAPDGRPRRMMGTHVEVQQLKETEIALRRREQELAEREAQYRDLVENQPLMIERYLPDTTITYANGVVADCLGAQAETVVGQRWLDYLPAEEQQRAWAHLASYTPESPVGRFEHWLPGEDGRRRWMLWTVRAFFDEHGRPSHFQSVGVDITERRRAERAEQQLREQLQARQRELEAIFEAARSVSLVKTDLSSVIQEVSTGAEVLFGYSREELIGHHVGLLHTEAERERFPEYLDRLLCEREAIGMETELVRRDGTTFPALFTLHPIADPRGEVVATLGVSLDISDRKRAERELAEAVEAKSSFLNAVSHDLRTPLNALMGFLDLLDEPQLTEQQRAEYMQYCRQGAQRLRELIDSLLDLSRLQAGRLSAEAATFDLHAMVERQCTIHRHLAADRGLVLDCRIGSEVPRWVEGDATRLGQVLSNLLGNAVKYTDEGRVDLEVVPQGDGWITFQVRDTGPGIPPEDQELIFSAFERGGYAGAQCGHGLGLAIVRELLQLLGGELSLDSEPGVGTTFSVTVPLPAVAAPARSGGDGAGEREGAEAPQAIDSPERPLRVLVADDEPANVMLARIMLEQLGCAVTTAEDGNAALAAWRNARFDLLVLDRGLPDLDGERVAEHIRSREPAGGSSRVPIALYTAYGRSEVEDLLEGAAFDAYLGKPLDRSRVAELVEWVWSRLRPA